METVFINFKNLGIKASLNKDDFDPAKHKLWTDENTKQAAQPLPAQVATVQAENETGKPWKKPAVTRGAKG